MTPPDDDDDKVGYGKPPKHTRFQKGRSGNPKGRPKGSINIREILKQELNDRISVTEGGRTRKLPKKVLLIKSTLNNAIKGQPRATAIMLGLVASYGFDGSGADAKTETFDDYDAEMLDRFLDGLKTETETDDD